MITPQRRSRSKNSLLLAVLLAIGAVLALIAVLPAATGDTIADRVLGQPDFFHSQPNFVDQVGYSGPVGMAIDSAGHLYVADTPNSRVLAYASVTGLVDGEPATLVIGQPSFFDNGCNDGTASGDASGLGADSLCRPAGVAVDSAGNLYVSDTGNNRVLEYPAPFSSGKTAGESASAVFGQSGSFTANSCNGSSGTAGAATLCFPKQIAFDASNNLYIADMSNNRVLEISGPLSATSVASDLFGQTAFTGTFCNQSSPTGPSATTLCDPNGVTVDAGGNVYIGDSGNSRVLEYNAPAAGPFGLGPTASRVFGQAGFTTSLRNGGGAPSAATLNVPDFVFADSGGNLFVTDSSNNRVLEYFTPLKTTSTPGSGDTTADVVYGQAGSFTTTNVPSPPSASSLHQPAAAVADSTGDVLIADSLNYRVLFYPASATTASIVLGQFDLTTATQNLIDGKGLILDDALHGPASVAVDSTGHLYVADPANDRVLAFSGAPSFPNHVATMVFGQPDAFHNSCNDGTATGDVSGLGPDSLCNPTGVAVDFKGNLYVADTGNDRVLVYNTPFNASSGEPGAGDNIADRVIGESNFTTTDGGGLCFTSNGLQVTCGPMGLGVDSAGDLYVADSRLNRVEEFNAPLSNGESANLIFGQPDPVSDLCNQDNSAPSASTLCNPGALALDASNNLYVADSGNNRLLEYNTPLSTTSVAGSGDTTADHVFGQFSGTTPSFTTGNCPASPSPITLCLPGGVAVDSLGNVFVSDTGILLPSASRTEPGSSQVGAEAQSRSRPSYSSSNGSGNRVLEYQTPLNPNSGEPGAGGAGAFTVFGQNGSFTTANCNGGTQPGDAAGLGPDSLCVPIGLAVDPAGNLYVADAFNNRVLEFDQPLINVVPTPTATVTATATATTTATATAVITPTAIPTPGPPTGVVSVAMPVNVTGSPGQTLSAGQFTVSNGEPPSGQDEIIQSITIQVTDPQLIASMTLRGGFDGGFQNVTVSPVTAETTFTFSPPEIVPPGQIAAFNLSVVLAGTTPTATPTATPTSGPVAGPIDGSMIPPSPPASSPPAAGGSGLAPFGIGMVMLGLTLLAVPSRRRRGLALLACALLLVAASQVGCDPCPACTSTQNTATLTVSKVAALDESEVPVSYSGLPAGVAIITVK